MASFDDPQDRDLGEPDQTSRKIDELQRGFEVLKEDVKTGVDGIKSSLDDFMNTYPYELVSPVPPVPTVLMHATTGGQIHPLQSAQIADDGSIAYLCTCG